MEEVIRRSVERLFPELTGGYHLPRFGRVTGVADAPAGAAICDDFRPRFAVDVEVLGQDGEPDTSLPMLAGVPLPMPMGGDEMGFFAFPAEGTTVVLGFAYGLPHKPFIQAILPHGLSLPKVPKQEQVWQHNDASQQRAEADGSWLRTTDGRIRDTSSEREVQSLSNSEKHQSTMIEVDDHSTESVGGIKKIEALGALKLLSGGAASLAAVDDLHAATGRDYNLVIARKLNSAVGGDLLEVIQGHRRSISPKNWIGSESVNVFQVLCDLIDLVTAMNADIASHVHGSSPVPTNAGNFTAHGADSLLLSGQIKPITGA